MKNVNNISICRDNYSSREEWEDSIKKEEKKDGRDKKFIFSALKR